MLVAAVDFTFGRLKTCLVQRVLLREKWGELIDFDILGLVLGLGSSSGVLLSVPVRKYRLWLRFRAETSPRSACFLQVYSLYHADCSCSLRVSVCVCVWLHNRCRPLSETQPAYYGWSGCACMRVHMQECCVCVYSDCCC